MDPWESSETEGIKVKLAEGSEATSVEGFTDNFSEQSCPPVLFEKLPDSEEYIKLLESKLKKITDTSGKKTEAESKKVRQNLVADLSKIREDTLAHLLTGCDISTVDSDDIDLDTSLTVNPVIRRLVPEQAISPAEQIVLTTADHLEKQTEEERNLDSL